MNNQLYRVGIYLRLSNEDRDKISKDEDSESIKNQRNMLIDYIDKHQEFILVDEYCDEDLSGAGTYRPEFERLITDCENGKLDVVLCKSQSRFSRDMEIVERYINNKFKEWNIRFIGISDNSDTLNIGNKKSRQINGLVNEWYLEDISNNIRSAFYTKMKQGEFISPFTVFGYDISVNDNNKLVIDMQASLIVKDIFNLYLDGYGFTSIANYLNDKNIPSPSLYKYNKGIKLNIVSNKKREDIKWNPNAIKNILTNEIYLGHLIQGKRTTVSYKNHKIRNKDKNEWIKVLNTHEPIIDEDTFFKVNKLIKERSKVLKSTGKVHLFSGKIYCYECGKCMRKKSTSRYDYLVCFNKKCSNKISIRYDALENIILEEINKKLEMYLDKDKIKNLCIDNELDLINKKINDLEIKINCLENSKFNIKYYLKNVYEDKVNKIISDKQFNDLINTYDTDLNNYNKEIEMVNNEICYYKNVKNSFNVDSIIDEYSKFNKLSKVIIDEFIDRIFIGNGNNKSNFRKIYIKWNF